MEAAINFTVVISYSLCDYLFYLRCRAEGVKGNAVIYVGCHNS